MREKKQILRMIDFVSENDISILLEVVRRFVSDDVATPDDIEAIKQSKIEYAAGGDRQPRCDKLGLTCNLQAHVID